MIGILEQILCWIKQLGAMFLSSIVLAVNGIIAFFGATIQGIIDNWPLGFPTFPSMPSEMVTAIAWIRWSPFPLDHVLAFFAFYVTVTLAWFVIRPILKWAKIGGEDASS